MRGRTATTVLVVCLALHTMLGACLGCPCRWDLGSMPAEAAALPSGEGPAPTNCCEWRAAANQRQTGYRSAFDHDPAEGLLPSGARPQPDRPDSPLPTFRSADAPDLALLQIRRE